MFNKKSLFIFIFTLTLLSLVSCSDANSNTTLNSNNTAIIMSNDSMRIFSDTLDFNEVYYVKQSVYYDSLDYEMVLLINTDTVNYYKNELYSSDSIYDVNNDQKNDLSVVYQSTDGFVSYVYLFDPEKNALKTNSLAFHNYVPIDKNFFYLVNKNYFIWEFKKHQWNTMKTTYLKSIYVDFSSDKRKYFTVVNHDTVHVNANQITKSELKAINEFMLFN